MFLRSKLFLAHRIRRTKRKGLGYRKASTPEEEHNFYSMKRLPPLSPSFKSTHRALTHHCGGAAQGPLSLPQAVGALPVDTQSMALGRLITAGRDDLTSLVTGGKSPLEQRLEMASTMLPPPSVRSLEALGLGSDTSLSASIGLGSIGTHPSLGLTNMGATARVGLPVAARLGSPGLGTLEAEALARSNLQLQHQAGILGAFESSRQSLATERALQLQIERMQMERLLREHQQSVALGLPISRSVLGQAQTLGLSGPLASQLMGSEGGLSDQHLASHGPSSPASTGLYISKIAKR